MMLTKDMLPSAARPFLWLTTKERVEQAIEHTLV